MNVAQAKAIPMRQLLAALGYQPAYEKSGELWYCSPFREEKEPSFKLAPSSRAWFDHGAGKGGSVIDFCCAFWNVDVSGALRELSQLNLSATPAVAKKAAMTAPAQKPDDELAFSDVKREKLSNPALKGYLATRGIPVPVALPFVEEIHYTREGKPYFALGFPNKSGGCELRNPYYKGCLGNKDISVLVAEDSGQGRPCRVYEGFMDFLSDLARENRKPTDKLPFTAVVLNSAAMRSVGLDAVIALNASEVHLYFDNDRAGLELTQYFREGIGGLLVVDHAQEYAPHKDLNEWLQSQRKSKSL